MRSPTGEIYAARATALLFSTRPALFLPLRHHIARAAAELGVPDSYRVEAAIAVGKQGKSLLF
jgi:hypothetical protein